MLTTEMDAETVNHQRMLEIIQGAMHPLAQITARRITVAASQTVLHAADLPAAYEHAVRTLPLDMLYETPTVLEAHPVIAAAGEGIDICPAVEAVRRGNKADYDTEITHLLDALKPLSIDQVRHQLSLLSVEISNLCSRLPGHEWDPLPLYSRNRVSISAIHTHTELMQWLDNLYLRAVAHIEGVQSKESAALSDLAVAYIQQHYTDTELSAAKLAEVLGISPSHLSRILKEGAGISFPELLLQLRMERAKQLLIEKPEIAINELCFACGYSTPSYFTSAFKKYFGVPPSKFRALHIAQRLHNNEEEPI